MYVPKRLYLVISKGVAGSALDYGPETIDVGRVVFTNKADAQSEASYRNKKAWGYGQETAFMGADDWRVEAYEPAGS